MQRRQSSQLRPASDKLHYCHYPCTRMAFYSCVATVSYQAQRLFRLIVIQDWYLPLYTPVRENLCAYVQSFPISSSVFSCGGTRAQSVLHRCTRHPRHGLSRHAACQVPAGASSSIVLLNFINVVWGFLIYVIINPVCEHRLACARHVTPVCCRDCRFIIVYGMSTRFVCLVAPVFRSSVSAHTPNAPSRISLCHRSPLPC